MYIDRLDLRRLHTTGPANTAATEDFVGDGFGGRGELQQVEVTALRVITLGPLAGRR
jgi:hypothetical protein